MGLRQPLDADRAGWWLSLYQDAGEAGGSFRYSTPAKPRANASLGEVDRDRAAQEAARRARGNVRRYCAANRLNRLGTLTYRGAGCHDPAELRQHVAAFFRDLRDGLGGEPLPYLWTAEWHKTGHGQHVHFAVGRYAPRQVIARAWGHGFVHIKLLGDLPVGSTRLDEARRAAGYLSKYVGKAFDDHRVPGLHRYEIAQGFKPTRTRLYGCTEAQALSAACSVMGGEPTRLWSSAQDPTWDKPPSVWASWS